MSFDWSVLRRIRKREGMTIHGLSELSGVSYVALSKLERNQANPEFRTIERVSRALGVPTHNLVALAEHRPPYDAREKHKEVAEGFDCRWVAIGKTRVCYVEADAGAAGCAEEFHEHEYEHCYVLSGRVQVTVRDTPYTLKAGEGLGWDSQVDHGYEVLEDATWVTVLTPKQP